MSKTAVVFLLAALASTVAAWLLPDQHAVSSDAMGAVAGIFAVLFVGALVVGRRFKFDPLLR